MWGFFLVLLIPRLLQGLALQSQSSPRAAEPPNPLGKWHRGVFPLWLSLSGWVRKGGSEGGTTPRPEQTVGEENLAPDGSKAGTDPAKEERDPTATGHTGLSCSTATRGSCKPDFPAWGKSWQLGMSSAFPEMLRLFSPPKKIP